MEEHIPNNIRLTQCLMELYMDAIEMQRDDLMEAIEQALTYRTYVSLENIFYSFHREDVQILQTYLEALECKLHESSLDTGKGQFEQFCQYVRSCMSTNHVHLYGHF